MPLILLRTSAQVTPPILQRIANAIRLLVRLALPTFLDLCEVANYGLKQLVSKDFRSPTLTDQRIRGTVHNVLSRTANYPIIPTC